tara:strand:- start:1662 stop:2726 length:1065 start_codon:yes stop_codon:yes gene_type:complete
MSNITNKLERARTNVSEMGSSVASKLSDVSGKATNVFKEKLGNAQSKITNSNTFGNLSSGLSKASDATEEFAEKNSFIAKVIFIVFVFILFGLFFRLGVYILSLFYTPSKNPIVIQGMRSTLTKKEYTVNPTQLKPKPILRSINENQGMEFTWSTWIWINSQDTSTGNDSAPKVFFTKGKPDSNYSLDSGYSSKIQKEFIMNSPGLYLYNGEDSRENVLSVVVSFFQDSNIEDSWMPYDVITIDNVPMKKWVNVIIRVQGRIVDIYINGTLTKRKTYEKVVKQNYGNIHVGDSLNGADAYISSLRYFNHAIRNNTIQEIIYNGPNLKMEGDEMTHTKPPYLAMKWYLDDLNETS